MCGRWWVSESLGKGKALKRGWLFSSVGWSTFLINWLYIIPFLFYFSVPLRQVKNFNLFVLLFIKFIVYFGTIYRFHYTIQLTFTLFTVFLVKKFQFKLNKLF